MMINVEVAFSQLAVFVGDLLRPFNDWTDRHVSQGFAWRPGSVSFRTLTQAATHEVDIRVVDYAGAITSEAIRAIEVPFEVPDASSIEIGSIADSVEVSIEPGFYLLRCEFLTPSHTDKHRVVLTFARKNPRLFAIKRADDELKPEGELLLTAEPAHTA